MTPDPAPLPGIPEPAEGRRVVCRLCKRPLRGQQARHWGLGPDCRRKLGHRTGPRPGGFAIQQDAIPGT